jgi:hypothetical protein
MILLQEISLFDKRYTTFLKIPLQIIGFKCSLHCSNIDYTSNFDTLTDISLNIISKQTGACNK